MQRIKTWLINETVKPLAESPAPPTAAGTLVSLNKGFVVARLGDDSYGVHEHDYPMNVRELRHGVFGHECSPRVRVVTSPASAEELLDEAARDPRNASAWYLHGYALGRYSQAISVAKALAQVLGRFGDERPSEHRALAIGLAAAAGLIDAINKHNQRNPGKEVVFLNYAAVDPDGYATPLPDA